MTKYWNESYETLPREQLDALKLKRLKDTVQQTSGARLFRERKFNRVAV